ncbi:heat shock protein beta-1-like, partial [Coregonus clupeaformis]|uniref:heat shock protein beta-1-like n=1 Tax=Coregonus clupeaformis TaxID=59861 RepID=UPI001BE0628C
FTMLREPDFDPFCNWHHDTRLFDQSFGMPQIPDEWSHWPGTHWPGYMRPPGSSVDVGFYFPCLMGKPYACTMSRQLRSGLSERKQTHDSWRISLDVNQFASEELVVKAKGGVIEIIGKHEERRDEHCYVSRNFTRKYTVLSSDTNLFCLLAEKVTSSLSPEGVLSVEAPLPMPAIQEGGHSMAISKR